MMRNIDKSILIVSILALSAPDCLAADASKGGDLARRWCAGCHVVAPDQPTLLTFAPPFASIAQRPNLNARDLANSLLAPHPQMPDRALSRDEAADIAAYIRSLRK
jgi:mono/diheme cytochrome c family protein